MPKKPGFRQMEQRIAELEAQIEASDLAMSRFESYMSTLHEIALGVLTELDLSQLLKNLLQNASKLIGTNDGYIFLHSPEKDELVIQYGVGRFEKQIGYRLKPGEGLSGKVWQSGEPMIVDEYDSWEGRAPATAWNGMGFDLGIPLKSGDQLIGVIGLCSYKKEKKIGQNEVLILTRFAELASIALNNADLHARLRDELGQKVKTEEKLESQNQWMNALLENLKVGVFMVEAPSGRPILANRQAKDLLGRGIMNGADKSTLSEVYQAFKSEMNEFYPQDQMPIIQGLNGKTHSVDDMTVIHPDGKKVDLEVFGSPVKDKDGKVIASIASFSDITERKKTEKELRTSHETFLTVLNSIDATVYAADIETYEILFMNKYMIDLFGKDLSGEKCWDVFRGESKTCPNCTNDRLLDKNGRPTGVYVWSDRNPITGKWYVNYDRAIEWTDGRLVHIQIATDITEMKQLELQLQQAQKMEAIGTLAGGIAHDFNNLLMGIQGCASLIMTEIDSSDPNFDHLKGIEEYVKNASNLTRQLLGFARGGKYDVLPTDINKILDRSARLFGRTKKEIVIHTRFQKDIWTIEVDQNQIEQVLFNLFVNAWQAMPDGGELYLQTANMNLDEKFLKPYDARPGRYVKISVTDTGVGMDEATQQKIFDPFFTTKDKSRGTGLGLASAYGIIQNHDGFINVYSEGGKGATFNIYLPASDKELSLEPTTEATLINGSETILLIDDEEMIIKVGQPMLERLGYRVTTARSGPEAIEVVSRKGKSIDLILLDLIMPGMDGGQTFDRIREIHPQMPVLLCSGYAINGKALDIMNKGCNGFIQKPYNIAEISKKVREVLDEAKNNNQE
jgi:PAS domain S-box-containing protein